jgi:adenylyl cyclase-associated protein
MSKKQELQPLQELLDSVLSRLDVLETKVGVSPPSKSKAASPPPVSLVPPPPAGDGDASPAVKAYDAFLETSVASLVDACDALGGMQNMGQLLKEAWTSIRTILVIAAKAKQPADIPKELQPHLKDTQTALNEIRKLRLDRKYDDHVKAILESSAALSWIVIRPPSQTPAAFVKQGAICSTEFWSNRIRKKEKSVDNQIAFCNALQQVLSDLVEYITQNAKTGLDWNPRGVSLAEAAIVVASSGASETCLDIPHSPRPYVAKVSGGSGGMSTLVAELTSKRTADGSSAATGLKHVRNHINIYMRVFTLRAPFFSNMRGVGEHCTWNVWIACFVTSHLYIFPVGDS